MPAQWPQLQPKRLGLVSERSGDAAAAAARWSDDPEGEVDDSARLIPRAAAVTPSMAHAAPIGAVAVGRLVPPAGGRRDAFFRRYIVALTFVTYCSFHLSRKPISVVKQVLHCDSSQCPNATTGWAPFDKDDGSTLLGLLDLVYLFSYAIGMFINGHMAERCELRHFIFWGALLSAIFTGLFGVGYYRDIHVLFYYMMVQLVGGFFQSTGWPSVVACMGNWCGKKKRGLVMGLWNSHTSVGNILGSVIAGLFVHSAWGLSFIVPAAILATVAFLNLLLLVPYPEYIGCEDPDHTGDALNIRSPINQLFSDDDEGDALIPEREASRSTDTAASRSSRVAENPPIKFWNALFIPGVIEYSLCLFFNKLVSYTFLFWLPSYIQHSMDASAQYSANLSTLFDLGGIIGSVVAGVITDITGDRSVVCAIMLALAGPSLFYYHYFGAAVYQSYRVVNCLLLLICGTLVNGPYGLITTAVAADLGTHSSLRGDSRALATVTSIIDGTGSLGAAAGPALAGWVAGRYGWGSVFYLLIASDVIAFSMLVRMMVVNCRQACYRAHNND